MFPVAMSNHQPFTVSAPAVTCDRTIGSVRAGNEERVRRLPESQLAEPLRVSRKPGLAEFDDAFDESTHGACPHPACPSAVSLLLVLLLFHLLFFLLFFLLPGLVGVELRDLRRLRRGGRAQVLLVDHAVVVHDE